MAARSRWTRKDSEHILGYQRIRVDCRDNFASSRNEHALVALKRFINRCCFRLELSDRKDDVVQRFHGHLLESGSHRDSLLSHYTDTCRYLQERRMQPNSVTRRA